MEPGLATAVNFHSIEGSRTFDYQQQRALPQATSQQLHRGLPEELHRRPLQLARFSPTPEQENSFGSGISGSGVCSVGPSSVQQFGGSVVYGSGQGLHLADLGAQGGGGGSSGGASSGSAAFEPQAWPGLSTAPVLNDPAADPFAADWHEDNW